jgi:hypothetical protein
MDPMDDQAPVKDAFYLRTDELLALGKLVARAERRLRGSATDAL